MRSVTVIALLILFSAMALQAQKPVATTADAAWNKADNFYKNRLWDSAAFYYEAAGQAGNAGAPVYYNLGNAYFRLHKTGYAILNYSRAIKRNPDDKNALENLELAESRIPGRIIPPPEIFITRWWKALTAPGKAALWSLTAFVVFAVALYLLWRRRTINGKRPAIQLIVSLFGLWAACLLFSVVAAKRAKESVDAVVISPATSLKDSPSGKATLSIPEGSIVERISVRGDGWTEVELQDGRNGWVRAEHIAMVD